MYRYGERREGGGGVRMHERLAWHALALVCVCTRYPFRLLWATKREGERERERKNCERSLPGHEGEGPTNPTHHTPHQHHHPPT